MDNVPVHRLSAFSNDPLGGNPAGVWIGQSFPSEQLMLEIASDVGYSETVFAVGQGPTLDVRYFSPEDEVSFCGHATIALGVLLGQQSGEGEYELNTAAGSVGLKVVETRSGFQASLTSVDPHSEYVSDDIVHRALDTLGWDTDVLDPRIEPVIAYAGARHLVLLVSERSKLAEVEYDFQAMKELMLEQGLTTVQILWMESHTTFHSRNLFPVGGVVEDPATGAAAAALGGHLRTMGLINSPFQFDIRQGEDMGRPSLLRVSVPIRGGIEVTGEAVAI